MPWTKKQKGMFGAAYAAKKSGDKAGLKGPAKEVYKSMTKGELRKALKEPTKESFEKRLEHALGMAEETLEEGHIEVDLPENLGGFRIVADYEIDDEPNGTFDAVASEEKHHSEVELGSVQDENGLAVELNKAQEKYVIKQIRSKSE